ncbi:transcription activator [Pontibacillus chungwhensis BH030062]|uniref:Transcription activator n=1 Tax=Pontibacillus chungwhensis BH030062 TaxID=1385513 RepID=A0A0A2VA94_9BACI|nr:transcription activator [Pontibacillus chungwhensis BH030062]
MRGIKTVNEKKLVGYRVVCNELEEYGLEIPIAFERLESRKDEINQLVDSGQLIGAFKASETSIEDDGYWVCYEVYDFEDIPKEMVSLAVPAQKYAVLNYKGEASGIYKVYDDLHQWIEEQGYKRVPAKWSLEVYSKWSEHENDVELCDPVM